MAICRKLMLHPHWVLTGKGPKYFEHTFPMDQWEVLSDDDRRVILEQIEFLIARKKRDYDSGMSTI